MYNSCSILFHCVSRRCGLFHKSWRKKEIKRKTFFVDLYVSIMMMAMMMLFLGLSNVYCTIICVFFSSFLSHFVCLWVYVYLYFIFCFTWSECKLQRKNWLIGLYDVRPQFSFLLFLVEKVSTFENLVYTCVMWCNVFFFVSASNLSISKINRTINIKHYTINDVQWYICLPFVQRTKYKLTFCFSF